MATLKNANGEELQSLFDINKYLEKLPNDGGWALPMDKLRNGQRLDYCSETERYWIKGASASILIDGRVERGTMNNFIGRVAGNQFYDMKGNLLFTIEDHGDFPFKKADAGGSVKNVNAGGSGGGCYVATCVYGSYDCLEVRALRRFRDDTLNQSRLGRAFICIYYAVSPKIVKLFGNARWFKKLCKPVIDRLVSRLRSNDADSSPYSEKFLKK